MTAFVLRSSRYSLGISLSRGLSSKLREPLKLNAALRAYRSQPIAIPPASEDEGDALLSAAALRFLSDDPSLFELHNAAAKNEGWIFGVPIEPEDSELDLTPEQTTEIERRLESSEPYASDAEVRATFRRLT